MTKKSTVQKVLSEYEPKPVTHLNKNSKMPCRSFDLQAGETCPGSFNSDGSVADVCKGCYAKGGFFQMPTVKNSRADNKLAWQKIDWVDEMCEELDNDRYFRFFTSGDGYSIKLWEKIYEIASRTIHCNFWIPTRMYKFESFRPIIDKVASLPNVVVRFSSDSITGGYVDGLHGSTVIESPSDLKPGMTLCEAYANGGKCGRCRACWSKNVPVIAYPSHGTRIKRVYKTL
jgi:hypothetical protein